MSIVSDLFLNWARHTAQKSRIVSVIFLNWTCRAVLLFKIFGGSIVSFKTNPVLLIVFALLVWVEIFTIHTVLLLRNCDFFMNWNSHTALLFRIVSDFLLNWTSRAALLWRIVGGCFINWNSHAALLFRIAGGCFFSLTYPFFTRYNGVNPSLVVDL